MALIKTLTGQFAKIKILGVGGGGNNAINSMIDEGNIKNVNFIAINTDSQALLNSKADIKVQIGEKLTKGLGAGGNPQIGQQAAEESENRIRGILEDTNMVFITGGMGGGTCTGAAPVIAKIAKKELKILTIAVVTKPFLFEGTRRMTNAEEGISLLKNNVDALIVIPNQKVMEIINNKATLIEAFKIADSVLNKGTKAIAEIITRPGLINLDFADIKSIMSNAGSALMGVGEASGEDKIQKAISEAIDSPLVEIDIDGAKGILVNITGGPDLTMNEVEKVASAIHEKTASNANIIFGTSIDKDLKDTIKVTVIATGFDPFSSKVYKPKAKKIENINHKENCFLEKPTDQQSFIQDKKIQELMKNHDIPAGVEIEDEFDIPAFLRKK
jgi:cell division protein FtsZ